MTMVLLTAATVTDQTRQHGRVRHTSNSVQWCMPVQETVKQLTSRPATGCAAKHSLVAEPPPPLTPLTEIDGGQPWSSAHGGQRPDTRRSAAGIQCPNTRISQ